jgi:hypothetical protein
MAKRINVLFVSRILQHLHCFISRCLIRNLSKFEELVEMCNAIFLGKNVIVIFFFGFISVISNDSFGRQDRLLIPKFITPKKESLRQINKPQTRWLVNNSWHEICGLELKKDGYSQLEEGCVFWSIDKKQCTLVTTNYTSHALLGELFMRCIEGN